MHQMMMVNMITKYTSPNQMTMVQLGLHPWKYPIQIQLLETSILRWMLMEVMCIFHGWAYQLRLTFQFIIRLQVMVAVLSVLVIS